MTGFLNCAPWSGILKNTVEHNASETDVGCPVFGVCSFLTDPTE
jgi:hypothetical protein